jgi:hypothetical protein
VPAKHRILLVFATSSFFNFYLSFIGCGQLLAAHPSDAIKAGKASKESMKTKNVRGWANLNAGKHRQDMLN